MHPNWQSSNISNHFASTIALAWLVPSLLGWPLISSSKGSSQPVNTPSNVSVTANSYLDAHCAAHLILLSTMPRQPGTLKAAPAKKCSGQAHTGYDTNLPKKTCVSRKHPHLAHVDSVKPHRVDDTSVWVAEPLRAFSLLASPTHLFSSVPIWTQKAQSKDGGDVPP